MLKIRMQRTGRTNMPTYRIVVAEHTESAKSGRFVERLGSYNPKSKQRTLNAERVAYWLSVGAQPSDTVHNMLVSAGVINAKKINVLPAYKAPEKPAEEAAPTSAAGAPAESAPETPIEEEKPAKEEKADESAAA